MLNKQEIIDLLNTNDRAVERALVVLYDRQTKEEKITHGTKENNAMGFSRADAKFGTRLAEQLKQGRHLSPLQLSQAREMLRKYSRQLLDAAELKARNKQ